MIYTNYQKCSKNSMSENLVSLRMRSACFFFSRDRCLTLHYFNLKPNFSKWHWYVNLLLQLEEGMSVLYNRPSELGQPYKLLRAVRPLLFLTPHHLIQVSRHIGKDSICWNRAFCFYCLHDFRNIIFSCFFVVFQFKAMELNSFICDLGRS